MFGGCDCSDACLLLRTHSGVRSHVPPELDANCVQKLLSDISLNTQRGPGSPSWLQMLCWEGSLCQGEPHPLERVDPLIDFSPVIGLPRDAGEAGPPLIKDTLS